MKIIKLTAENIKRLKAVEIAPDGSLVEVTGPNGSGKSSVLDAIFYALAGTGTVPTAVVRRGEEKAFVKLDLGELVVTRRFTATGGTTLTVEAADGARYPSPQRMLDDLVGSLSFDPLAFTRMAPKEQLEALRAVVHLDVDIDQLDRLTTEQVGKRTVLSREIKQLEARIAATPTVPEDTPNELLDVTARVTALEDAAKHNFALVKEQFRRAEVTGSVASRRHTARELRERAARELRAARDRAAEIIFEAEKREAVLLAEAEQKEVNANFDEVGLSAEPGLSPAIDTAVLKNAVNQAMAVNRQVELKQGVTRLRGEIYDKRKAIGDAAVAIEENRARRAAAIAAAEMPVPGLSFGEGEVLLNGLPLANASGAEQLRISVALAMAANPRLRVLRVKDGSLLDEANLRQLAEMAQASDYQVWIERVEESTGGMGVVMEDGAVHQRDVTESS